VCVGGEKREETNLVPRDVVGVFVARIVNVCGQKSRAVESAAAQRLKETPKEKDKRVRKKERQEEGTKESAYTRRN
jgi:hypothetical protein